MDDDACNEQLLGLEMRRLNNNEGTDDLYNNIANIYKKDWYKIDLNEEDTTQSVGFSKQLQYQVYKDNDIIQYQVEWESSNPEVAKVDEDGILTIVGIGKSVIECHLVENKEVKATFIVSGIKKEEYREINDYWTKRLVKTEGNLIDDFTFKHFDHVEFTLGYPSADNADARARFKFDGIEKNTGRIEWGAESGKIYYVIKIGERVK